MRILLATDGSPGASTAEAFLLALPLSVADRVTVLTVPRYAFAGSSERDAAIAMPADGELHRGAALVAERARARFVARDVPASVIVRDGPVADAICAAVLERGEELIVVGSRGLGPLTGVLLGSTGRALSRRAPISLLVVRETSIAIDHVLAAVDGSAESDAAIELLARMPLPETTSITLLHVLSPTEPPRYADERNADGVLGRASDVLRGRNVTRTIVERGDAAERIVSRATASGAGLIVLGSHGQCEAHGILRTSVADDVLHHAHCAVLVARPALAPRILHVQLGVPESVLTLA